MYIERKQNPVKYILNESSGINVYDVAVVDVPYINILVAPELIVTFLSALFLI